MTPADRSKTEQAEQTFELTFPARTDALARARRAFADWLCPRIGEEVSTELEIVFSELAANAVDASPDAADEVTGTAWCDGHDVVLDLANHADPTAARGRGWDLEDPLRTGGRGLVITEAFVDSIEVRLEPGQRLVVRCRRHLD